MAKSIAGLATAAVLITGTLATPAEAIPSRGRPNWREAHEGGLRIERWEERKLERQRERRREHRREERREARAAAAAAAAQEAVEPSVAPVPSYAPVASAGTLSEAEAASYLAAAGFPESVIPTMIYIGHRESGLCPTAVYGYGCAGAGHFYPGGPACSWLQLYPCPGPEAADPAVAARYAYAKYEAAGGLSPWAMTAP